MCRLPFQKIKFWNFRRSNYNGGDKLALTVSEKLSQYFFSVSKVIMSDSSHWVIITRMSLGKGPTL